MARHFPTCCLSELLSICVASFPSKLIPSPYSRPGSHALDPGNNLPNTHFPATRSDGDGLSPGPQSTLYTHVESSPYLHLLCSAKDELPMSNWRLNTRDTLGPDSCRLCPEKHTARGVSASSAIPTALSCPASRGCVFSDLAALLY